ncbi:MAG TPA: hypothetical protein VGJ33_11270 [Candidatus Angelobacter sp.]|jgi:hypothetical protein
MLLAVCCSAVVWISKSSALAFADSGKKLVTIRLLRHLKRIQQFRQFSKPHNFWFKSTIRAGLKPPIAFHDKSNKHKNSDFSVHVFGPLTALMLCPD